MSTEHIRKENIAAALAALPGNDFLATARSLLETLGYWSELTLELQGSVDEVVDDLGLEEKHTNAARNLSKNASSVGFIFQVGEDEISATGQQTLDWGTASFERGHTERFNFVAVELHGASYARSKYAEFTREINTWFNAPAVILFKTADNRLTLAFVHRRQHRYDRTRDVLGNVSLIREINPTQPHRAHLDILSELSLENLLSWMSDHNKPYNFDGLLAAWLDTLNTEALNKRFYTDLFRWFEWAVAEATFPTKEQKVLQPEEHIIRLITRLLFVWFIKEKGLIADDLFNETKIVDLLKNYDRATGDSYYRAVLQNLFFATLNTEMDKRGFSKEKNATHRNFSLYRYKREINDPAVLLGLFAQTPFINGGLFDCLDSEEATRDGGYRIDCFSDNERHSTKLSIPNRLFFDEQRGLVALINHYKFTVEENTPVEQEVALDPELLGKVFENLLAAYNPETRQTARKQTGSYYTPRAVVDYMVDEALIASLAQKYRPTDGDATFWQERLRYLLNYEDAFSDADELFDTDEAHGIVRAIADLTVLDPAVGSGAFPMGVLHKLTLALGRIDPDNTRWQALQKERARAKADAAFETKDQQERGAELLEISETFEKYSGDFGRKLYLIQNSIFGVDIQPIACQIAKLRFFISLAIEQQPDKTAKNFSIRPLPNLETRFIAADTLLTLQTADQLDLFRQQIETLKKKLVENRERHFHATTRRKKLACKTADKTLRTALSEALQSAGLPEDNANKIAQWDPYDQNAKADWFDPEYMFGNRDGFDVSIGNPPYVRADSGDQHQALRQRIEDSNQYETLWEKWDLYIPFIERAYKLLKPGGFTTLIVSDAYCHSKYAQKSQGWFLQNSRILRLDFLSKIQIFDAAVRNVTYLFQKADGSYQKPERRVHEPEFGAVKPLTTDEQCKLTYRAFFPEDSEAQQFSAPTVTLDEICYITKGMVVHAHERKAQGEFELRDLVSDTKDEHHPKPFVEGKHLERWLSATNKWLEWGTERAPDLFSRPTFPEIYEVDEKILVQRSPGPDPKACYDDFRLHFTESSVGFILWYSLSGVRNRSIKKQTRYRAEKPQRPDLPRREELEKTSYRFAVKFLLGVMNSTVAHNFLRANRRSNIHLYPDDWKKLPIPDVAPEEQASIVELVNQVLKAKAADPQADTGDQEAEIDRLAYALYGLTGGEIGAVESRR